VSSVPPSAYNALAQAQEGDSSIDPSIAASGMVADSKNYSSNRIITTRPIAWSNAGVGISEAHPSFGPAEFVKIMVSGNVLIADSGRMTDINIVSGRNFGAWSPIATKPIGEVQIGTVLSYDIGSSSVISAPVLVSSGPISSLSVSPIVGGLFGTKIGAIRLFSKSNADGTFAFRMMDSTGYFEDIQLRDWLSADLLADSTNTFAFGTFGLQVTATRSSIGTITAGDLAVGMSSTSSDIFVRETVSFTEIIPLPDIVFINDPSDPSYSTTEYEWKSWAIPTQAQLNADLAYPYNAWQPYMGDPVVVTASPSVVAAMNAPTNTLLLINGITINRFSSTWTPWASLDNLIIENISDGITIIGFTLNETVDINRLSIYSNGIQMNPASYAISGASVVLSSVLVEGTTVALLYRAYQPSSTDLVFNPVVKDNFSIQTQYKQDYQYTQLDVRDSVGNISGTKYYFWVKNKTIPSVGKSMSLVKAAEILSRGESSFTIFSRLLPDPRNTDLALVPYPPTSFDSCAIAGLGANVSKENSFKLRFLRDFTLLDDPEELNLKNVHTEWTLIRKNQSSKIPSSLWNLITNAACGMDIGGNTLPSQVRINYDNRNGTNYKYGFKTGQIFAETSLVVASLLNTILNTQVTVRIGNTTYTDYITALDLTHSENWFASPTASRQTMNLIWNTARAAQINELFFNVLDDALSNNYEFSDLFKTSLITINTSANIISAVQSEQVDEQY
jgi:hypothetical protein